MSSAISIVLVKTPSLRIRGDLATSYQTLPIGLSYFAAYLREQGFPQVTIIDSFGEDPNRHTPWRSDIEVLGLDCETILEKLPNKVDYLGISCMFSHEWVYAIEVIRRIRLHYPNTFIIAGGEHPTALPEFCLESAPLDACALGEGEHTLVDVIRTRENNGNLEHIPGIAFRYGDAVIITERRPRIDPNTLPPPAWDLIPVHHYFQHKISNGLLSHRAMPILASRGCPFRCTFCSNTTMWGLRFAYRSPHSVVAEIQDLQQRYGVRSVLFCDLTAIASKKWLLEFCDQLEKSHTNIKWELPSGTRSEALDAQSLSSMYRTGCFSLTYAPESGSEETLVRIEKKLSKTRMMASIRAAIESGIKAKAQFIIGFPGESRRDMLKTLLFMLRLAWLGLPDASVVPFLPYPGSNMYRELVRQGRINEKSEHFLQFLTYNSYTNILKATSWNETIGDRELRVYFLLWFASFYLFSFLVHPWRLSMLFASENGGRLGKFFRVLWRGKF
ncbi:MAG: B12-binding domain-containing radical SAM protein [Magnetococcales bacterium]|nr:B12-binding domain-containing radical SAM protein [Magnetococcales bacterium]